MRLRSGDYVKDLFTGKKGEFSAAGIPPGRLELTPFLPGTLKVPDVKELSHIATMDECVMFSFLVVSSDSKH